MNGSHFTAVWFLPTHIPSEIFPSTTHIFFSCVFKENKASKWRKWMWYLGVHIVNSSIWHRVIKISDTNIRTLQNLYGIINKSFLYINYKWFIYSHFCFQFMFKNWTIITNIEVMDICSKVIGKWYRPNLLVIHFVYIKSQIIIWLDRVYALKLLFYTRKEFLFTPPKKKLGMCNIRYSHPRNAHAFKTSIHLNA